jgi:hypothetical protein
VLEGRVVEDAVNGVLVDAARFADCIVVETTFDRFLCKSTPEGIDTVKSESKAEVGSEELDAETNGKSLVSITTGREGGEMILLVELEEMGGGRREIREEVVFTMGIEFDLSTIIGLSR